MTIQKCSSKNQARGPGSCELPDTSDVHGDDDGNSVESHRNRGLRAGSGNSLAYMPAANFPRSRNRSLGRNHMAASDSYN